jgi:hypothetical protein
MSDLVFTNDFLGQQWLCFHWRFSMSATTCFRWWFSRLVVTPFSLMIFYVSSDSVFADDFYVSNDLVFVDEISCQKWSSPHWRFHHQFGLTLLRDSRIKH